MAKWEEGDQTELPDDEPLSDEDMAHIENQRVRSQAALIQRSAAAGMTPMEMMASGQVTAHVPDDALAFDKSRQLPAPEKRDEIKAKEGEEPMATALQQFSGRLSERDPEEQRLPHPTWDRPKTVFQDRIDRWMVKDGGRSFMEGFDSYSDAGSGMFDANAALKARRYDQELPEGTDTPRAGEDEAVPSISEDEVAEGEIVEEPPSTTSHTVDDIVDAEVVEDGL